MTLHLQGMDLEGTFGPDDSIWLPFVGASGAEYFLRWVRSMGPPIPGASLAKRNFMYTLSSGHSGWVQGCLPVSISEEYGVLLRYDAKTARRPAPNPDRRRALIDALLG